MALRPGRIGICWFLWREENRSTRRKTLGRTRTNNILNPHMTPGPGIEPGPHWWKASALTTAPSLLPCLKGKVKGAMLRDSALFGQSSAKLRQCRFAQMQNAPRKPRGRNQVRRNNKFLPRHMDELENKIALEASLLFFSLPEVLPRPRG